MTERLRIKQQPVKKKQEQPEVQPTEQKTAEEIKAETDRLLDEIDEVLADVVGEGTAQAFIDGYQQKGGQ